MIVKVLVQVTNWLMAMIIFYVNDTFFVHSEMSNAHVAFSSLVILGCLLSSLLFVAFAFSKIKLYEKVFPYDSAPIFIALIGALVTAIPFSL